VTGEEKPAAAGSNRCPPPGGRPDMPESCWERTIRGPCYGGYLFAELAAGSWSARHSRRALPSLQVRDLIQASAEVCCGRRPSCGKSFAASRSVRRFRPSGPDAGGLSKKHHQRRV